MGLGLEWEVWAWGRKHYAAQEAAAQLAQADAGVQALRSGVLLQAQAALAEAQLARQAHESSHAITEHAAENLRILRARFEAHTATAADLLQAETLHTKAATAEIGSAIDYLVAIAMLQDILGLPVQPLRGLALSDASLLERSP